MNYISIPIIAYLDKKTHLESSYSDGKVLTISGNRIFFDHLDKNKNQLWELILNEGKILMKNGNEYICYIPGDSTEIQMIHEDDVEDISFCEWNIGNSGELYHKDDDGEKFLWVTDDNMCVISDGYLADKWKIYDDNNIFLLPQPTKENNGNTIIILLAVVVILSIIIKIIYDQSRNEI